MAPNSPSEIANANAAAVAIGGAATGSVTSRSVCHGDAPRAAACSVSSPRTDPRAGRDRSAGRTGARSAPGPSGRAPRRSEVERRVPEGHEAAQAQRHDEIPSGSAVTAHGRRGRRAPSRARARATGRPIAIATIVVARDVRSDAATAAAGSSREEAARPRLAEMEVAVQGQTLGSGERPGGQPQERGRDEQERARDGHRQEGALAARAWRSRARAPVGACCRPTSRPSGTRARGGRTCTPPGSPPAPGGHGKVQELRRLTPDLDLDRGATRWRQQERGTERREREERDERGGSRDGRAGERQHHGREPAPPAGAELLRRVFERPGRPTPTPLPPPGRRRPR